MSTAVVFGASGGIGAALTEALAASGRFSCVHAGSRSPIASSSPGIIPFTFDLKDEGSIAVAAAGITESPDLVIVASGLLHDGSRAITPEKTLRAISGPAMSEMFAVNTIGPALIASHILPRMSRSRRSVFTVLSARVGSIGDNRLGGWHAYRASKAALNMVVANLAIEMRRTHPHAIVAALHPGTVATALSAPFRGSIAPERLFSPQTSANHLLRVIDALTEADNGGFFAWDGSRIPW